MAGSWNHMINDDGSPYDERFGEGSMLENGGDIVEALEECYGMIWWMAMQLDNFTHDFSSRQGRLAAIADAKANYQLGIKAGKLDVTIADKAKKAIVSMGWGAQEASDIVDKLVEQGVIK